MAKEIERELLGRLPLGSGGRVLIETDPLGVRVAWSTPTGGRDHAHLSAMSTPQIELVLSIFREEGTELTAKPSCEVLNRLAVALDPQARLQALLGMAPS